MRSAEENKLEKDLRKFWNKLQRKVQKLIDEHYEDEIFPLQLNKVYTIVEEMKPEYRAILLSHGLTQFYNARETTTTLYTIQQKKVSVKARLYEPQIIREEDVGLFRTNPQIEDSLRYNTFQASDKTLSRVTQNITNNLADSYHEGLGIKDAGCKITREFSSLKGWESHRIARTEINTAQNEGAFSAYDELGVEYHMWWTGQDNRVRDSHAPLHGHIVAVGNTFSNGLLYPGDKSGPIKEWINCRCTTVPFIIPLGKMAPPGLTEFTEDQLVDIPGYVPISIEDALNGEYPLDYYHEGGVIDQYRMESPYRQLKNAIADELKGFIPEEDIDLLSSELAKHKLQTDKLKYERLSLWDNEGRKILNSYTEYLDAGVNFPDTVPEYYKFAMHNHPKGHSPIPSFEDINELLYSRYSFTSTMDNGLIFIKYEMRIIDYNRFERDLYRFYDKLNDDFERIESRYLSKLDNAVSQGKISQEKADLVENYKYQKYLSKNVDRYCSDLDNIIKNYGMEIKYVPNERLPKIDNFKQKQSFYRSDYDGNIIGRGLGTIKKSKNINTSETNNYVEDIENPKNYKTFKGTTDDGMLPTGEPIENYFTKNVVNTDKYDEIIDKWVYKKAFEDVHYFNEVGRDKTKLKKAIKRDNSGFSKKQIKEEMDRIIKNVNQIDELMKNSKTTKNIKFIRLQKKPQISEKELKNRKCTISSLRGFSISSEGAKNFSGKSSAYKWTVILEAPAGTNAVYIAPKAINRGAPNFVRQMETIIGPNTECDIICYDTRHRIMVLRSIVDRGLYYGK